MQRKKDRQRLVRFPVFSDYLVHIIVTNDIHQQAARLHTINVPILATALMVHDNDAQDDGEVWILVHPNATLGTIAHECFHAVWHMMKWVNATSDDEIIAYHLGYLVNKVVDLL